MKSKLQDEIQQQAAPGTYRDIACLTTPFPKQQRAYRCCADRRHRNDVPCKGRSEHEVINSSSPVLDALLHEAVEGVELAFAHFAGKPNKEERG